MRIRFRSGAWTASALAAVFGLVSVLLLACSDDDGSGVTGASDPLPTIASVAATAGQTAATEPLSGGLVVFAAASLTDAFDEVGAAFMDANPEVNVEFNFQGSSALRIQIEEGAPSDVFASANTSHMDALVEANVAKTPTIFVHNSLVIITPSDNPAGIESLADLQKEGLKLVLAAEEVPVGGYSREMFEKANADPAFGPGFSEAVLQNVVSNESNVKQVVTKVQLGEADAGVVYGSDVTPDVAPKLEAIQVPATLNVIADYPIATLTEAENPEVARAFVAFVLGPEGQEILARWGFSTI